MTTLTGFRYKTVLPIASLLFLSLLGSCAKEDEGTYIIWDINPVTIDIRLLNSAGQNLLSPATPGTLYDKTGVTIEYDGESYGAQWSYEYHSEPESRAYFARFDGLRLMEGYTVTENGYVANPDLNYLTFGEFDGARNQDLSFTLNIEGHPQTYHFKLVHTISWKKGNPVISNSMTLNGVSIPYRMVDITL